MFSLTILKVGKVFVCFQALMMALGGAKGCWLGPTYIESRTSWWDEEGERYLG